MLDAISIEALPGGRALISWFGQILSFHDAEIVNLSLDRSASSILTIYCFRMTDEVDTRGYFIPDKHALVTFQMDDIIDLKLDGFSVQNVIFGLTISKRPDSDPGYDIDLEPCFGLSGRLSCRSLSVLFRPLDGPLR